VVFKSLLPAGLAGAAILIYLFASVDWALLKRARLPSGVLLFCLIWLPWVLVLSAFDGKDDESKVFWYRYFVHDLGLRLVQGVHTTTPKDATTFVYFIEQLGFGLFPWVAIVPGAFFAATRGRPRDSDYRARVTFVLAAWVISAFAVVSLSATQFHHYGFPVIPPLCVLFALYADQLWEEGVDGHHVAILAGIALYAMVAQSLFLKPKHLADLFLYNYDRPYPAQEVDPKNALAVIFGVGGVMIAGAYLIRAKEMLFAGFTTVAIVFALYMSWMHWRRLSPHWAQRDIFWSYYEDACPSTSNGHCNPDAPIVAYFMNWRGETFYSENRVRQIKDPGKLMEYVAQPGREYVIVEQSRYQGMVQTLGDKYKTRILDKSCNKFYLVSVD
jgi:4-amino-4-deoxy-L-arabinose transferase-like glycosyltransferase